VTGPLPDSFRQVNQDQPFCFSCHPGVPCFTECCRQLDLALTPYDVLRLRNSLQMHSGDFLEQYVIIEWDDRIVFPQCYLSMVDDGRASCVFVSPQGCKVYKDRPGACRAYPVGRGASRRAKDQQTIEHYVLVKEPHCRGFDEFTQHTPQNYLREQGVDAYSRFNDAIMSILQHEKVQKGFRPDRRQLDQYILALYNLDLFRQEMSDGRISFHRPLSPGEIQGVAGNEEQLLLLGISWLQQEYFDE
jgi:Fe-S-cluster containining protein